MQTPKARNVSYEVPRKVSPPAACRLKTIGLAIESGTSNQLSKTLSEQSPKVAERRSPRSLILEKKRLKRISELESQVSHLQDELKKAKDELRSSDSGKKEAQQYAEEYKRQPLVISLKLEETQKQLAFCGSEDSPVSELEKKVPDETRQSEAKGVQIQQSASAPSLASCLSEIEQLKAQLQAVSKSEYTKEKEAESANDKLQRTKESLIETSFLVDKMRSQLKDSEESEAHAQALATETLVQLETAKKSMEALKCEGKKAIEAYNSIASELDRSRARVNSLEGLVSRLEADLSKAMGHVTQKTENDSSVKQENGESLTSGELKQLEEVSSLKAEVEWLRSALEAAENRCREEQSQSSIHVKKAQELSDQIKSETSKREAELVAELGEAKSNIEELKAHLMDKETDLQHALKEKLEINHSYEREKELKRELYQLQEVVADLKAHMMDKETELQSILEQNEMLRFEIAKKEMENGKANENMVAGLKAARAAEQEALVKLGLAMEEADKSKRGAKRVGEQLEAAQAANSEIEAELRRLKVQCDQWRKAAEAAVAMLSTGHNGKFMERTGSNDMFGDIDDDLLRKKNANMLKKIGMLWKKQHD